MCLGGESVPDVFLVDSDYAILECCNACDRNLLSALRNATRFKGEPEK